MDLLVADVGGTHARFAISSISEDGTVALGDCTTLATGDFPGVIEALDAFVRQSGVSLPTAIAIAAAGPVRDRAIALTNNRWTIEETVLRRRGGFDRVTLINDFGAVAHAVARAGADELVRLAGPDRPLPDGGITSVIGPGTGLGVAYIHREAGRYWVQATEGGHIGFSPQDGIDDRIMATLRARHGRVVSERVVAGPGIAVIYAALGGSTLAGDRAIWAAGLDRSDAIASAAIDRFCAALGAAVGDYALAQGANGVVLAGGLARKLRERLPASQFAACFVAKPGYEAMMAAIPIKLITHPQPGLIGAAAAFAIAHEVGA